MTLPSADSADALWPSPLLEQASARSRIGYRVRYYPSIGSTNDEAKRLAEGGAPEGTLLLADEQTAGRGRLDRKWSTPAGQAVAMSLVLRPALTVSRLGALTLLGGLAVARALEVDFDLAPELKWPNDVLLSGKKVAGVLVEGAWSEDRLAFAVLGIGINVHERSIPRESGAFFPATFLDAHATAPLSRARLLAAVLGQIDECYRRLLDPELTAAWSARLAYKGRRVSVTTPSGMVSGVEVGVDESGALVLQPDAGEPVRVIAGDVRLRPMGE